MFSKQESTQVAETIERLLRHTILIYTRQTLFSMINSLQLMTDLTLLLLNVKYLLVKRQVGIMLNTQRIPLVGLIGNLERLQMHLRSTVKQERLCFQDG